MATWLEHIKLNFGGALGQPNVEVWSNTIRFAVRVNDDPTNSSRILSADQLESALADLKAPLITWFTAAATGIHQTATLQWAKLNMINTLGRQWDGVTHQIATDNRSGGIQGNSPHWYQTCALTMRTAKPRGRAHSGRIFPPVISYSPEGNTPYFPQQQAGLMAGSFTTLLEALSVVMQENGTDGPGLAVSAYPVIASPAANTGPNPGGALLQRVTGVVVDRVGDVQHRRTHQVPRLETGAFPVAGA